MGYTKITEAKPLSAEFGPPCDVDKVKMYPFVCEMKLDEKKGPRGKLSEGQTKQRNIEELLDLADMTEANPAEFKAKSAAEKEEIYSKVRTLQMLASGKEARNAGRGCEVMAEDGAVIFLGVQNRHPEKRALVEVKMNDLTAGLYVLRPNERVNIRHPCVGESAEEKAQDRKKWKVVTDDVYTEESAKKKQKIGATSKVVGEKVVSKAPSVEVTFLPEHTAAEAAAMGPSTRTAAHPPELYDPAKGLTRQTVWGERAVTAVVSKTYRRAVAPATLGAKGKVYEDFTTPAAGLPAAVGQGDDFSAVLYDTYGESFTVAKHLAKAETLTRFSFLIKKPQ